MSRAFPEMRLNVHVAVLEDGREAFWPLHLGFFPPAMATRLAAQMSLHDIAYYSGYPNQLGTATVMLCPIDRRGQLWRSGQEVEARRVDYTPRHALRPDDAHTAEVKV